MVWVINGRMMSYNANARVGTVRASADSEELAILQRVDRLDDSGLAIRVSVLTIQEHPGAVETTVVQCHNGSANEAETQQFMKKVAG